VTRLSSTFEKLSAAEPDAARMQIDTMRQFGVQACLTKPLELAETLRVIDLTLDGFTRHVQRQ